MDFSQIRRELTVVSASLAPRERPPTSPKRTPKPREGDTYDELLDYDSDTYEYRRKRGPDAYKPIQFVYAGKFKYSAPSDEEVERNWELMMAKRRRWASAEGPLVFSEDRPRFAGLGSVKEFQPYPQPQATSNESSAV